MPRPPRIDRPNLFYHVMARGNNKARIFFGSEDYRLFEELLKVCLSRYRLVLHAYCLMPNHVYVEVHIKQGDSRGFFWGFVVHNPDVESALSHLSTSGFRHESERR